MRPSIRVVGVGSPHGDDQLGWRLVEGLAHARDRRVEAVAVAAPLDLLGLLEGCRAMVVIDACQSGRTPGSVTMLNWPDDRIRGGEGRSTHGIGLASTLALAEALGRLPPRVLVFAVEAGACPPAEGLSPTVTRTLARVRRRLHEVVARLEAEPAAGAHRSGVGQGSPRTVERSDVSPRPILRQGHGRARPGGRVPGARTARWARGPDRSGSGPVSHHRVRSFDSRLSSGADSMTSPQETLRLLRSVHFLHDIPEEYLRPLASITEVQEVPEGGVLFREGQPHRYIYFVIEGSVALEIQLSGRTVKRLQTVGVGDLLGWSSVVTHASTTATARALQPSRVAAIDSYQLMALCEHNTQFGFEFMKRTAQTMAKRLSATRLQLLDVYRDEIPAIPGSQEV